MMFLKLSLNGLLYTIVMAMACSTDENARIKSHNAMNYHSSNCLVPFHYNLKTTLQLQLEYFSRGEYNATIYINCAIQNITLHMSEHMRITSIELKSANSGIIYTPKYSVNNRKEIVVLDFVEQLLPENNLERGLYTLYVVFFNAIPLNSTEIFRTWYTYEKGHEKSMIYATLLQPRRARLFFPCWDEPQLSATFTISVEHDTKYKVLSNMPIRDYELIDLYTMVTIFHKTPPMSANDVAIMVYNTNILHEDRHSTKTMVNTWCRSHLISHMKFAKYVAGNVTMYLENNWKILKSVPKVNYVAIPNFEHNIWQTWGLVFYNEADIIYNEKLHPAAFKTVIMRSIAHDLTLQWFGNFFDPFCQSYWWLNEGFSMFLETYIIDKAFSDSRLRDLFLVQIQYESRHLNTYFAINGSVECTSNILKSNSNFPFPHIIGAVLWRMLESVIPNNAFWMGIDAYLNTTYTYFNSKTPDDLWNVMQTVINVLNPERYDLTAKQMMDIWTVQEHCPVLNVTRDYSSGRVIISKELQNKLDGKPYFIPVTCTTEKNINFDIYFPTIYFSLTQYKPKLEIPFNFNDDWFIVNIQQAGYYRVNYDPENWLKIARYLNSVKYTNIHVLNRAQIIDDAFHLAIEKKLNISIFWELASYLPKEKDFVAWYPMIKVFEYISNIFAFSKTQDELSMLLKDVLLKIRNLFEDIGEHVYDQTVIINDDLSKYLKQELAKWGCIIDHASCLSAAKEHLQLYLGNPQINKILPGWEKWTYCNGLKTMKYSECHDRWNSAFNKYKEKSDHKMLEFFSCSEDPLVIIYYLHQFDFLEEDVLKNNENKTLAEKERFYALTANNFLSTLARHAKNIAILKKILQNFNVIKNSRVSMNAALSVMINNAYSAEQLEEIKKFVRFHVTQFISDIQHKIATRLLEIERQMKFFQTLFG